MLESNNNNAIMKVFIPFLKATVSVLQDITQEVFSKKNIYPFTGNISTGDLKVEIGVVGDIQTRVFFDFPKKFAIELAAIMMGIAEESEIDDEVLYGAVQELGNMISGNAIGHLEELNIHCDITPPIIHASDEKLVDDTAQLGVIEFTGELGNFNIYVVINESKYLIQSVNILSINFSDEINIALSRFFFPKGIGIIGATPSNMLQKSTMYDKPTLIIINVDNEIEETLDNLKSLPHPEEINVSLFGESSLEVAGNFKEVIIHKAVDDPYTLLEAVKKIGTQIDLQIFAKRREFSVDIPKDDTMKAFFEILTQSGKQEIIPISHIGLETVLLDISHHQDINFPEGKNLPNVEIRLNDTLIPVKAQIGKILNEEETLLEIKLRHILETEVYKITEFLYKIITYHV